MPDVLRVIDRIQDQADVQGPFEDGDTLIYDDASGKFIAGAPGGGGGGGSDSYLHIQSQAASVWTINHNLGRYPSITIIDSAGNVVVGDIAHNSINQATASFSVPFSGFAPCT